MIYSNYDSLDRLKLIFSDYFDGYTSVVGAEYLFNAHNQYSRRTALSYENESYWDYTYNDRGELEDATRYLTSGLPSPSEYHQWHYDNIGNSSDRRRDPLGFAVQKKI